MKSSDVLNKVTSLLGRRGSSAESHASASGPRPTQSGTPGDNAPEAAAQVPEGRGQVLSPGVETPLTLVERLERVESRVEELEKRLGEFATSARLNGPGLDVSEPAASVDDMIQSYNLALGSGEASAEFDNRYRPLEVGLPTESEFSQAGPSATPGLVRLQSSRNGSLLLVEVAERKLLMPIFLAMRYHSMDFQVCFDLQSRAVLGEKSRYVLELVEPAECVQVGVEWELKTKGKLVIAGSRSKPVSPSLS